MARSHADRVEPHQDREPPPRPYRRAGTSRRGEVRRRDLLARVTEDLAANGLVDFSLRRAARAAGTTHKVLLYYFASAEDLLGQAVLQLRERRLEDGLAAARDGTGCGTLAGRTRALWPVLVAQDTGQFALDQAIGLAMYDPERYGGLGRGASDQYLPGLMSLCPPTWSQDRKHEVAQMVLGTLRGFLLEWRTTGDAAAVEAGFAALARALDREEAGP